MQRSHDTRTESRWSTSRRPSCSVTNRRGEVHLTRVQSNHSNCESSRNGRRWRSKPAHFHIQRGKSHRDRERSYTGMYNRTRHSPDHYHHFYCRCGRQSHPIETLRCYSTQKCGPGSRTQWWCHRNGSRSHCGAMRQTCQQSSRSGCTWPNHNNWCGTAKNRRSAAYCLPRKKWSNGSVGDQHCHSHYERG